MTINVPQFGGSPYGAGPVGLGVREEPASSSALTRTPLLVSQGGERGKRRVLGGVTVFQSLLLTTLAVTTVTAPFFGSTLGNRLSKPISNEEAQPLGSNTLLLSAATGKQTSLSAPARRALGEDTSQSSWTPPVVAENPFPGFVQVGTPSRQGQVLSYSHSSNTLLLSAQPADQQLRSAPARKRIGDDTSQSSWREPARPFLSPDILEGVQRKGGNNLSPLGSWTPPLTPITAPFSGFADPQPIQRQKLNTVLIPDRTTQPEAVVPSAPFIPVSQSASLRRQIGDDTSQSAWQPPVIAAGVPFTPGLGIGPQRRVIPPVWSAPNLSLGTLEYAPIATAMCEWPSTPAPKRINASTTSSSPRTLIVPPAIQAPQLPTGYIPPGTPPRKLGYSFATQNGPLPSSIPFVPPPPPAPSGSGGFSSGGGGGTGRKLHFLEEQVKKIPPAPKPVPVIEEVVTPFPIELFNEIPILQPSLRVGLAKNLPLLPAEDDEEIAMILQMFF